MALKKISFLDVNYTYESIRSEIDTEIFKVLHSGQYIGGEALNFFEDSFCRYFQTPYTIGCGNGLDAIFMALKAMNIGLGDEVIVPSHTFIATWLAVTRTGATIVPVEPDLDTYNIDVSRIENSITLKTKAIIPVHLYGQPCDLDEIKVLADRYSLSILEDAAQCHGAYYKNMPIGAHGNTVAWSFYPGKNLGAFGDGGAITTFNKNVAENFRKLSNYGSETKYAHDLIGYNSRLDTIQASILSIKLRYLKDWNSRREDIARVYLEYLTGANIVLPKVAPNVKHVWHLFVVRHPRRDDIRTKLNELGIETGIHYPKPPHLQKAYVSFFSNVNDFPIAEKISSEIFSLPMGPHLSIEDAIYVSKSLLKILGEL